MREIAYRVREQVVPPRLSEGEFFIILRDDVHLVCRGFASTGICFRATDTIWFPTHLLPRSVSQVILPIVTFSCISLTQDSQGRFLLR